MGGNTYIIFKKIKKIIRYIFVDHFISARQPDIVVIDKNSSLITLIDVSVPADKHLSNKEEKKFSKYQDLRD